MADVSWSSGHLRPPPDLIGLKGWVNLVMIPSARNVQTEYAQQEEVKTLGEFLNFMGGHSCYEGGHRAHGGPPTRENPGV